MELTTIQAAAFLQVSRPHLLKMIKAGEFSCRLVGTHRRIKLNDLMGYRAKVDAASTAARAQITQEAEEHGWY